MAWVIKEVPIFQWDTYAKVQGRLKSCGLRGLSYCRDSNVMFIWVNVALCPQDFSEEKPIAWSHFTAEGDVEFKSILFIPPKAPSDLYESYYSAKANLKLYVRRVFISDEFEELLPKYLGFLMVSFFLSLLHLLDCPRSVTIYDTLFCI